MTDSQHAEDVVRRYLDALAAGNAALARTYLSQGDPTEASFMNSSAHIASLHHSNNPDGTIGVQADIETSSGEYYVTFTVQPIANGGLITDHTAIKPTNP
jgi:hypothetical protein